ncbi:hypothetical protein EYF80_026423 [Liparis tanakae]|uniref:Uncharacterized protein n=1 Tax=Liparis tanakae TaxID=230148 RepID=A0A4Z2HCH0_9TELE|nr:hypothetical protein EYF80_026423 [Liparis tanakae]
MLVPNKQLSLGRSHSWDTLGGNEGQWERAESVYEQQARVAGRRSSLSYGEGGAWYEPPPGVHPPDLDLKRDSYSCQGSPYGPVYAERQDPRGLRKGSVPDLTHYERTHLLLDPKKTVDPEFLALLRNEGLSESTISSLIQQGFDSTSMLAVMEENDVRTVAANLGQARVLSRLAHNCKRPPEAPPAPPQPQAPMRGRSNSFSHRSDVYQQQHHSMHPSQALTVDAHMMHPQTPGAMQTISPRMGDVMVRRPNSAPSQHLMEVSGGYPGQPPRSPGSYAGALMPVQSRPMSAYSSGMPMHVPMELMKRDRNLLPLSPMHSPHPSPQMMRKGGGPAPDNALIPMGPPGQSAMAVNQKLSRRTGPPVIVSTMMSPDTTPELWLV